MKQSGLSKLIYTTLLLFFFCYCNKNTDQLPVNTPKPNRLIISGKVQGLNVIDFILEQNKTSGSDTVWLSIRNNTLEDITALTYVVEMCRAKPLNFDNCDLEVSGKLAQILKAGQTVSRIYTWENKGIQLDSSLIRTGIIAYSGREPHPLGNVYQSVYSVFETDTATGSTLFYGHVRGYIQADGSSTFRFKDVHGANYNASGQFTLDQAFDGLFMQGETILAPFNLDTLIVNGNKVVIDNSNSARLRFRLRLQQPLNDTIQTIQAVTQKRY